MPSPQPSAGLKAIRYAEDNLGVHTVYDEVVTSRSKLDEILSEIAEKRDARRAAEDALRDREMEIAADEWSKHPDFSATKMDGHLKTVRHADGFARVARDKVATIVSQLEGLEFDKQKAETDIKIGVARLNELGGYLNYLAAIREAETARHSREA